MSHFYYYPHPDRKIGHQILALVVEKKGDESRTSRKQDEIFVFSPLIRKGDGYMILQKIYWNDFEPGQWIRCHPTYAVDKLGNLADEKELTKLMIVPEDDYKLCGIPSTRMKNGAVQIKCMFVMCPKFIKNQETLNKRYMKLYLKDIGQGFVDTRTDCFRYVSPGQVYFGVFEFRAMDNGAVNFSRRSQKDVDLERTAMWQLMSVANREPTEVEKSHMVETLRTLKKDAVAYEKYLSTPIEQRQNPPIVEVPQRSQDPIQRQVDPVQKPEDPIQRPLMKPQVKPEETVISALWKMINEVIVPEPSSDEDEESILEWKDQETGEVSDNYDFLVFKLCCRQGYQQTPVEIIQLMTDIVEPALEVTPERIPTLASSSRPATVPSSMHEPFSRPASVASTSRAVSRPASVASTSRPVSRPASVASTSRPVSSRLESFSALVDVPANRAPSPVSVHLVPRPTSGRHPPSNSRSVPVPPIWRPVQAPVPPRIRPVSTPVVPVSRPVIPVVTPPEPSRPQPTTNVPQVAPQNTQWTRLRTPTQYDTSPERPNEFDEMIRDPDSESDELNETSYTVLLKLDNNANPPPRAPRPSSTR
uniref:DNMT1-RFD domain-containing protein n=1 Tax=Caenorhabditis tropicalis TaxID=1561998 RepID=A0A1I7UBA4_9PELO